MSFLKSLENQLREEARTDAVAQFRENKKKPRYTKSGRPFTHEETLFHEALEFTTHGLKAGNIRIFKTPKKEKVTDDTLGFMKNLENQLRTENFMKNLENQLREEAKS